MAYKDAFLTKDSQAFMGGSGSDMASSVEAAAPTLTGSVAASKATLVTTADTGTLSGWTEVSTDGWGFIFGSYPGPTVELAEQGGSADATFRQSLQVQDLEWTFQIDVNSETFKIFGNIQQKRRRWVVAPNGYAVQQPYDTFVAWTNANSQDNGGRLQYNVSVLLNGPVTSGTLPNTP